MKSKRKRHRGLSGLTEKELEVSRDNSFLDCAETAVKGGVGFCEEGVRFAYEQVKKVDVRNIRDLLTPQFAARSRCEGMKVKKRPASSDAMAACIGGSSSFIARVSAAKSLKA